MLKIKESFTLPTDSRAHSLLLHYFSIQAADQDTWCKLFKTKAYERRVKHTDKVIDHVHRLIQRMIKTEGLHWYGWKIVRKGSDSKIDVELKINQQYEIERDE